MFNPDYPTNVGSFTMNTYNNQYTNPQSDSVYWNGVNPFQGAQTDSRRNIGFNNPMMGAYQQPMYQQPAMNNNQFAESQLQPFSSYPPQRPTASIPATGLNTGLNSRRNDFGVQPTAMPQQQPVMNMPIANNPYMQYGAACGYDPSVQSLYAKQDFTALDRKNCWDNPYTQPRQIETPYVNWNQYQQHPMMNLNPSAYTQQVAQQYQQPQYPASAYPSPDKTWLEIAKANWGV